MNNLEINLNLQDYLTEDELTAVIKSAVRDQIRAISRGNLILKKN